MTNAILINKVIYNKLKENTVIWSRCPQKIFPLVAEQTTTFPFIVYWRNNVSTISMNKDGYCEDSVSFTVAVVDTNYSNTLELANEVRKSLEFMRYKTEEMDITNCHLTSIDETY